MGDDNHKEEDPTTSKNLQNVSTDDDQSNERRNSEVSVSGTYSNVSGVMLATTGPKKQEKKKVKQRQGRIEKRKIKRKTIKRKSRTRVNRRKRDLSVSTIFTRLASTGYQTPTCNRCGHRCCLRSFKKKKITRNDRKNIAVSKKNKFASDYTGNDISIVEATYNVETGSGDDRHIGIPDGQDKMKDVKHNYPVGTDKDSLLAEVLEKLRIAEIAGIVSCSSKDTWSLGQALQKRELSDNHVTLFWKAYGDTLAPLPRPSLENKTDINDGFDNEDD